MTFNEGSNVGSGNVSRRGRTGAIAGGGGLLGVIAVFVISQLTGFDLSGLMGGGDQANGPDEQLNCTAEQANTDDSCRVEGAAASLETYWSGIAPELGFTYTPPT